jgi:hypothetical protein
VRAARLSERRTNAAGHGARAAGRAGTKSERQDASRRIDSSGGAGGSWTFAEVPASGRPSAARGDAAGASTAEPRVADRLNLTAQVRRVDREPAKPGRHEARPEADEEGGKPVAFPGTIAPSFVLPPQSDRVASTLTYKSQISGDGPAPDPGDFGTTRPFFTMTDRYALLDKGVYTVTATVTADVKFGVTSGNRKNIASDSDANITQTNYPDVVRDLTPSPTAVHRPGLDLFAGQPPRTHFWAEDLTIVHERVHADEDVMFGGQGVVIAQNFLNAQTANSYDDVGRLFQPALNQVVAKVDKEMAFPGREERAYSRGAAAYRDRAQAIKRKGDARGYVPQPAPTPTPTTPPGTPTPAPAPNAPPGTPTPAPPPRPTTPK